MAVTPSGQVDVEVRLHGPYSACVVYIHFFYIARERHTDRENITIMCGNVINIVINVCYSYILIIIILLLFNVCGTRRPYPQRLRIFEL